MFDGGLVLTMIGLITLMSVLPAPTINNVQAKSGESALISYELKIDTKSPYLFSLPSTEVKRITLGESKYQNQIASEAKNKTETKRLVIARSEPINRYAQDRSYEDKLTLAKQAAQSVGMDWKVLMAVWQIESGASWDTTRNSYMGATGPWQFMPGTWKKYAVDANGDGEASIHSAEDGAYAAAKLLAASGAAQGQIDQALFSYNHSQAYVNKVKRIAEGIME